MPLKRRNVAATSHEQLAPSNEQDLPRHGYTLQVKKYGDANDWNSLGIPLVSTELTTTSLPRDTLTIRERACASMQFVPPAEVLPNKLFVGSLRSTLMAAELAKLNIGLVLSVGPLSLCADTVPTLHVDVGDSNQVRLAQFFPLCNAHISQANKMGKAALVHCSAGVSRSCSIVLSYLVSVEGLTLLEAMEKVKENRPCVAPNENFMTQLIELEKQCTNKVTVSLEGYSRGKHN
eukprot:TRINITY_DN54076_c0_g1_i1.p1 TRINITY_DN54076_c0_g1~~TRINITY_DN54076_c0_g1_i1.p1  ORF type:complete len:234 (+),score=5.99 TRINITY_DN54076_c0_g1_i1:77-778(+)